VNLRAAVVGGFLVLALAPALPAARAAQERGQARDAERAGDQAAILRRTQEFLRAVSRGEAATSRPSGRITASTPAATT
jgi:hypothetical protein